MSLEVAITKKLKDITLDISFSTSNGEGITGILGASGCGKSMTLKCIAGIVTPDQGRIVLNGRALFDSSSGINLKTQDRGVGYLFQNYALFPHMTVRENVEMALKGTKMEKRRQADQYLSLFHVEDLANHYPARLSGGQQQRIALARIMASKPSVLMLDEPFSALDYYLKENLQLELLKELKSYQGDVLLVTHSRDEIYRFCETIHVLEQGRMVTSGGVKEVFHEPRTVATAKLTGCKNIERIEVTGSHTFYVPNWGLSAVMKRDVPESANYIGVRAHYLRKAEGSETNNVIPCKCVQILDDPFEVTLILDNGIWWKLSKEKWSEKLNQTVPDRLVIPEESIFFLNGEE